MIQAWLDRRWHFLCARYMQGLPHESLKSWFGMVIEEILVFLLFFVLAPWIPQILIWDGHWEISCVFVFAPWIPQILIWDGNWGNSFFFFFFFWLVTWPTWQQVFRHIASLSVICSFLNVGANVRKPLNWTSFSPLHQQVLTFKHLPPPPLPLQGADL